MINDVNKFPSLSLGDPRHYDIQGGEKIEFYKVVVMEKGVKGNFKTDDGVKILIRQ